MKTSMIILFLMTSGVFASSLLTPSITVTLVGSGELSGDITFNYEISNPDSLPVNLFVEYNIGSEWFAATVTGQTTEINPDSYSGSIVWNSILDAGGEDSESTGIRITPSDSVGSGEPGVSETFHVDNNDPPSSVTTVPLNEYEGDVTVNYQLNDAENDSLSIIGEYSTGTDWFTATVSGDTVDIGPGAYSNSLVWHSGTDLAGVDDAAVQFRVVPRDNDEGDAGQSASFHVDNNVPPSSVTTVPFNEYEGDVTVNYQLNDTENDSLSIIGEYFSGTDWFTATVSGNMVDIGPGAYNDSLIWHSGTDLAGVDDAAVQFRVVPRDNDEGDAGQSAPFHVDNNVPPGVSLETPSGEQSGDVTIDYTLTDSESDPLNILCQFNLGDEWIDADVSGQIDGITSDNYSGSIVWLSDNNAGGVDNVNVRFRISTSDNDLGGTDSTGSIHLDNNSPPAVSIFGPADELRGDAVFNYNLFDGENDSLGLFCEYSIDDGVTWFPASVDDDTSGLLPGNGSVTWHSLRNIPLFLGDAHFRITVYDNDLGSSALTSVSIDNIGAPDISITSVFPAEISADYSFIYSIVDDEQDSIFLEIQFRPTEFSSWRNASIDGNVDEIFSPDYNRTLIWQTAEPGQLPHLDVETVGFRIRARDQHESEWLEFDSLHVDNNAVPVVDSVGVIDDTVAGPVDVPLQLSDEEGDSLWVRVQYSTDGGNNWTTGNAISGYANLTPGNYNPTFVWNSIKNVGFILGLNVRLRLAGVDNDRGLYVESNDFVVQNYVGDFSGDFRVGFDDVSGFQNAWIEQDTIMETGPVTGTIPDYTVRKDGVIDFEDLMPFVLMWNWSFSKFTGAAKIADASPAKISDEEPVAAEVNPTEDGSVQIALSIPGISDVWSAQFRLLFDSDDLEPGRAVKGDAFDENTPLLLLDFLDEDAGWGEINVAPLAAGGFGGDETTVITIPARILRKNGTTLLTVSYDLRGKNGTRLSIGTLPIELEYIALMPASFALHQNYPNPFNPSTTIRFDLPEPSDVRLSVYNLLGEEIRTLLDRTFDAGFHSTEWNGRTNTGTEAASGLYIYRIITPGFTKTRKLLLLR